MRVTHRRCGIEPHVTNGAGLKRNVRVTEGGRPASRLGCLPTSTTTGPWSSRKSATSWCCIRTASPKPRTPLERNSVVTGCWTSGASLIPAPPKRSELSSHQPCTAFAAVLSLRMMRPSSCWRPSRSIPIRNEVLPRSSAGLAGGREPPVQIVGSADQRQVREGLWEVAEMLRARAQLLAVQSQVIRIAKHLLEEEPRLREIAHAGQALDVPEGAHRERAVLTGEAVGETLPETIAIHQRVADELLLDAAQGVDPARVGRRHEAHQGHEQRCGIERGRARVLDEAAARRVPEALVDVAVDGVSCLIPAWKRSRERTSVRKADGAVDRHPAHHPRVEELPSPASHFPDALVLLPPVVAHPLDQPDDVHPRVVPNRRAVLVIQEHA